MRGCLGFLVFAAILVTLLAVAVVQLAVPAVVTAAVQGSSLVRGQPVDVHVDTSLDGVLLHGRIDSIRITGTNVAEPNATIGALDVTVADVSIIDRTFEVLSGSLDGVTVRTASGDAIPIGTVELAGSSPAVTATVALHAAETVALLEARLRANGAPAGTTVALTGGGLTLVAGGRQVPARFEVTPTALTLVVGALNLRVPVLEAPANGSWQIGDVIVSPDGLRLTVDLDVD